ncbi:MAG TPA: GNAT family N-acetyltransferase [Pyrinomonadaceae bacterium]|nr:GNAT family N-acetyltransferase [Pyrinomonadaceae bacterium]
MKQIKGQMRPNVYLVSSLKRINISDISKLLESVGMRKRNAIAMRHAIAASSDVAVAYLGNDLIGFGRMISDRTYYGTIWDVAVREDQQGFGIGKQIMTLLLSQAKKRGLYMVGLVTSEYNRAFYEQLGFSFLDDVHAMTLKLKRTRSPQ